MSEKTTPEEIQARQDQIFEDVRGSSVELFKETSAANSLPELVRDWAKDRDISEEFLARIYYRSSKVIRYANFAVGEDTDRYLERPADLKLHKDLVDISAGIERGWNNRNRDENWKKAEVAKIDKRIKEYKKDIKAKESTF